MIDDETHPEYIAVHNALFGQMTQMAAMEPFTRRLIDKLQQLADSATKKARQRGIDFPPIIVVYFKQTRAIRLHRRDADRALVTQYIRNLKKEIPEMSFGELYQGFNGAFPSYLWPDELVPEDWGSFEAH